MKRKLLLICIALLCTVGVWGYTSVTPGNNRAYFLYNVNKGTYWYGADHNIGSGSNTRYSGHTSSLSNATPTRVSISSNNYTFTYYVNGVAYQIRHSATKGDAVLTGGSADFQLYSKADGYSIEFKTDYQRRMRAEDAGTCDYPKDLDDDRVHWRFYAYEDILPTLVSNNASTCASTAASYVSGWERVTTKEQLAQNPEKYFYAIFSAVNPGVMMTTEYNDGAYRMCYKAAGNPLSSSIYDLFELENYNGEFAIKSNITGKYYGNASDAPWNFIANQETLNEACKVTVTCSNEVFNLQDKYADGNAATDPYVGNYLGAWDNMEFTGERLAGNKSLLRAGYFLIYRIAKKDLVMTDLIDNPDMETAGSGSGYGEHVKSWNNTGNVVNYRRLANSGVNNPDGAFTNTYCFENWTNASGGLTGQMSQTISSLPNGVYKLQLAALVRSVNGQFIYGKSNGNTYKTSLSGVNEKAYDYTVYVLVENNQLEIGLDMNNAGADWAAIDNARLTFLISSLPASLTGVSGKMNASVSDAQDAAIAAYNAVDGQTPSNYAAAIDAIANAEASIAAYAKAATYLSSVEAVLATTNFYTPTAYNSVYGTYKTAYDAGTLDDATADGLSYKVANYSGTERYDKNTANDLLIPGWTFGGNDASTSGSGFYINSWSTESDGSGDAADFANPFYEYWTDNNAVLSAKTISGTISGLTPNAPYSVTANVRVRQTDDQTKVAGSVTMQVGSGSIVDVTAGKQIGSTPRYIKSYTAVGNAGSDGKLTLTFTVAGSSNISWLAFRDVNYTRLADDDDYTALNSAIKTAEAKTLGFETGKYAPYNNIAALTALAAAQAINQEADNTQASVNNATTTLSGATWTENAEDVECVYNGDFALADDRGWDRLAWTRSSNWGASIPDNYGSTDISTMQTAGASTGHAYYNQPGSMQYGNTGLYTMPLSANTIYQLSFKYASESENSNESVTASVLNSGDGMAAKVYGANTVAYKTADAFVTKTIKFVTGAAGNYVLTLANSGNTVITDVSITKAANQYLEFADGSVPNYAPGKYPSVKITRTLTEGRWATAVYPFAVPKSSDLKIATISEYDKETGELTFDAPDASTANTPFLMRSTAGATEISLSDVRVAAASVTNATANEAHLIGTYSSTNITDAAKNYVLSANVIYPVGEAGATIPAYRAYFQIDQDTQDSEVKALTLVFDDADAIGSIVNSQEPMAESQIYNLAGQRLSKAQKGVNIINGKKVLVK